MTDLKDARSVTRRTDGAGQGKANVERRLAIWHAGGAPIWERVHGISNASRTLIREQIAAGYDVTFLSASPAVTSAVMPHNDLGVRVEYLPKRPLRLPHQLRDLLDRDPPDIVHLHSAFLPAQAVLARALRRRGIPYVVKVGGALSPHILSRGRAKKMLYNPLVQRPMLRAAHGLVLIHPREEPMLRAYAPGFRGLLRVVPEPVDATALGEGAWRGDVDARRAVYLGRFEPREKGLDRLVEVARRLPDLRIDGYGDLSHREQQEFFRLWGNAPPNCRFHSPVYGADKAEALQSASLYLHLARWEGFGLSIAEALWLGVPCAVAEDISLASDFTKHDLGLVLPGEPAEAATRLNQALSDRSALQAWSERGRSHAREQYAPQRVAALYDAFYRDVLAGLTR